MAVTTGSTETDKGEGGTGPAVGNGEAEGKLEGKAPPPKGKRKTKVKPKRKKPSKKATARGNKASNALVAMQAKYPRHDLEKVLRVPKAILEQNAGKPCSEREAAAFVGVGFAGPFRVELSSAIKFGLLQRPQAGSVEITDRARKILRPQKPEDELVGRREATLAAPDIGEVYRQYRGENLPDPQFFRNALQDKFGIPADKISEFEAIFNDTMRFAGLLEEHNGKRRLLDVSQESPQTTDSDRLKRIGRDVDVKSSDTCFVMMPFAAPVGGYYSTIYEPAIRKAGLVPVRADADIFGAGKIMDQIWRGITAAKVLVAELTGRNPNVFYELGLSHAHDKPVVLVCSNEDDVPFDLQHIRVIYYDMRDPFWGSKLIEKIAENILNAIKNPEEAVFRTALAMEREEASGRGGTNG